MLFIISEEPVSLLGGRWNRARSLLVWRLHVILLLSFSTLPFAEACVSRLENFLAQFLPWICLFSSIVGTEGLATWLLGLRESSAEVGMLLIKTLPIGLFPAYSSSLPLEAPVPSNPKTFRGSMAQSSLLLTGHLSEDSWLPTSSGLQLSLIPSLSVILLSAVSPPSLFVHMLYSSGSQPS